MRRALLAAIAVLALAACDDGNATPDWSRMITQRKVLPFEEPGMRMPPTGSVPRDGLAPPVLETLTAIPVPITRALLDRGRERFAITCAACHGPRGDGDSPVAHAFERRRPPSLVEARIAALTAGKLYTVVTEGYGFMPEYAALLDVEDRWAVVAYVRTLQLAKRGHLASTAAGAAPGAAP